MASAGVKRKLSFVAWANPVEGEEFDRIAAARALKQIPANQRVLEHGDALTAVEVVKVGKENRPTRLQLLALHDASNRPSAYGPSSGTSTITVGDDEYTAFVTHVSIWDDNIAAFDSYGNAPGMGRLAHYLWKKVEERAVFRALYDQSLAEKLKDLDGIRGVKYSIHTPHKANQSGDEGLLGGLTSKLSKKVPSFQVSMGMGQYGPNDAYLDPEVADEVLSLVDEAEHFFDSLIIKGRSKTERTAAGNPKTVTINLLSQRLQVEQELPRDGDNPSLPDRDAVFSALAKAYSGLKSDGRLADAVEARAALEAG